MGKNIWEIDNDIQSIINEIEEADGEITEEQEKALELSQEEFSKKVDSYCAVIDKYNNYISTCKTEKKRINDLQKVRENVINKLKGILLYSVEKYGISGRNGNKTYETATRKLFTKSVNKFNTDEERKNIITNHFINYIKELYLNGIIDNIDDETLSTIINAINVIIKSEYGEDFVEFNINDVKSIDLYINIEFKLSDLTRFPEIVNILCSNNANVSIESLVNRDNVKFANYMESQTENPKLVTVGSYTTEDTITIK